MYNTQLNNLKFEILNILDTFVASLLEPKSSIGKLGREFDVEAASDTPGLRQALTIRLDVVLGTHQGISE